LWPKLSRNIAKFGPFNWVTAPIGATLSFTLAIWFWHAPGPYDATFASPIVYWLMHITVVGSALMVWSVLLNSPPGREVGALAAGAFSTLQMTLLGALITMTPRPLYAPHALTPYAWGLTQASDQQLGGLIMWVPGCSVFLAVTLYTLARTLSEPRPKNALA
jgi:putative membrane protein